MPTTLIDAASLASRMDRGGVRVFDVRHDLSNPAAGWLAHREARVPQAVFLDMEADLSGARTSSNGRHPLPQREAFHTLMKNAGVSEDDLVVAYDAQGGAMSARLWWMMRWLGHARVVILDGGWQAWRAAGLPVEEIALDKVRELPGESTRPLPLADPLVATVDADALVANLEVAELMVLDARAKVRYLGEVEPLDPVAGHIPGALNRPHVANLDPVGRFKTAEVLHREFSHVLGGRDPITVVHQCGSGITACHNLVAMEHAGLHGSRLYPGSWSEWCSDPIRPVA